MGREITNYDEEFARKAAEYAESEQLTGGQFITTRGGVLRFGDEVMPGNQIAVVIVDSVFENTYYEGRFNADEPVPPVCYAFARGDKKDEMFPHPAMQDHPHFQPQNVARDGTVEGCQTCPMNEWGSADQGRGKACQNRRRLALLPAGFYSKKRGDRDFTLELFDDEKHYKSADLAFLKLPVTSVKDYSKYVTQLSASVHKPPFGVVTRIWCEADSNSQYKIRFEMIEELPEFLAPAVFARNEEARGSIITPYAPPREDDDRGRGRNTRGRDDRGRGRERDDRDRGRDRDDRHAERADARDDRDRDRDSRSSGRR